MLRKETNNRLMKSLNKRAREAFDDRKKVSIAKKKYLVDNKEEILYAVEVGYRYGMIAEVATEELLKIGLPKTFTYKTKEGEEKTVETKFGAGEIKKFCEPED